jgi:hypothetical protein
MRTPVLICYVIFLLGVLAGLVQMWFSPWNDQFFMKLMVTDGAVLMVVVLFVFFVREGKTSEKTKRSHALDD